MLASVACASVVTSAQVLALPAACKSVTRYWPACSWLRDVHDWQWLALLWRVNWALHFAGDSAAG
jgi:hypothetical protein